MPGLAFANLDSSSDSAPPPQEIKRRPNGLIPYLTNPDSPLPTPASVLDAPAAVKFRIAPPRDDWDLQTWGGPREDDESGWECQGGGFGVTYTKSVDPELGQIITWARTNPRISYLRAVYPESGGAACKPGGFGQLGQSYKDDDMAYISPTILITYGAGAAAIAPPPGYDANPDSIDSIDTLIYQTPGGDWVAQMFVSVGAAVVIMAILRSMIGLIAGIGAMPISAYGMASIGYGAYWYVIVMVLFFVLAVAAFTLLTRRPSG